MRALLQRVSQASVSVEGQEIGRIGPGLVVMLAFSPEDTEEDLHYIVDKVLGLRIFPGEGSHFHRSALDVGAELLLISQFTLYADTRKGRRPDFTQAASPEEAEAMYHRVVQAFQESGLRVAQGRFREHMLVEIHNDGPVTILLDSADRHRSRRG